MRIVICTLKYKHENLSRVLNKLNQWKTDFGFFTNKHNEYEYQTTLKIKDTTELEFKVFKEDYAEGDSTLN